jgi:DsbC/DsbD-like thiol-disulfide interchange protein
VASTAPIRFAICLFSLFATLDTACGQQASTQHARVELLSQQSAITPGADLQLGIHFLLEPGWHIYWTNPGDSGQPPSFQWQLPSGFTAGKVQWPRPERMHPSKALTDFGYRGEVLLPVTLHVAPSISTGPPIKIDADAKWLICREVCIPDHIQLRLTMPRAATANENRQSAPLFAMTRKLLPQSLPRNWKVNATSAKDAFMLTVLAGTRITKAEFFPLNPGEIDNSAPQEPHSSPAGSRLTLKKSDLLLKPISVLRGVLVIPGRPAYRIEAPVHQPIQ